MRRVDCRRCAAVIVEEVPRGYGKRSLMKADMLISGPPAAAAFLEGNGEAFRTSWDKVFEAVEHVVTFGWSTAPSGS
jgi:hypothetical protein